MLCSDCNIWQFQIFGIALGFNLLFEYDDLITGICFATVVPNLLPYAISHLVKKKIISYRKLQTYIVI